MRGGKRTGSGRPKINPEDKKVYKTVSISGTPEQIEALKQKAKEEGMSLSKLVIEKIL